MNFSLLDPSFLRWYAQGILRHIHSPSAWHSFALVCKYFAHLCRQEAEERKLEFCVDGATWMRKFGIQETAPECEDDIAPCIYCTAMILPNGCLHTSMDRPCHNMGQMVRNVLILRTSPVHVRPTLLLGFSTVMFCEKLQAYHSQTWFFVVHVTHKSYESVWNWPEPWWIWLGKILGGVERK